MLTAAISAARDHGSMYVLELARCARLARSGDPQLHQRLDHEAKMVRRAFRLYRVGRPKRRRRKPPPND